MERLRGGASAVVIAAVVAALLPAVATPGAARAEASPPPSGRIAFDSVRGGNQDLFIARSDGTEESRLTTQASGEAFSSLSSDAAHLAFASCRPEPLVGDAPCILGSSTPLPFDLEVFVTVPGPEGPDTRQLTSSSADDTDPAISPDGSRIAFASRRDIAAWEIYVVPLAGGSQTRLTVGGLSSSTEPAWSPDGKRVAFVRNGRVLTLSAATAEGLGNQAVTVTTGTADSSPAWSPDGTRIAFVRNGDIYTAPAGGGAATAVVTSAGTDADPAWAPTGDAIAVASNRDGDFDIYVHRLDGSSPTRVTDSAGADRRPSWADDVTLVSSASAVAASPSSIPIDQVPLQADSPRIREAGLLDVPGLDLAPLDVPGLDLAGLLDVPGLDLAPLDVPGLDLAGLLDVPGLDLAPLVREALAGLHLGLIPLRQPAGGWEEVFASTSLAGIPTQTVTLLDLHERAATDPALATALAAVLPSHLMLDAAPLGNLSVGALALGDTPVAKINAGFNFKDRITALGFDSAGFGPAASLLTLQLAGVPFDDADNPMPVHAVPLSKIDLLAGPAPVLGAKLGNLDLLTKLGDVRIADIPSDLRNTVVVCGAVDCANTSTETLLTALRAGGLRPSATFGDLGGAAGKLTLADLVLAIVRPSLYPLEQVPIDRMGLERWGGAGSNRFTLTARYSAVGETTGEDTSATFTLPALFSVWADSVTVDGVATTGTVNDTATETVLTVPLGAVEAGAPRVISFDARPGLQLDPVGIRPTVEIAAPGRALNLRTGDPVRVIEAFESNGTVATATPVTTGTMYVTHSGPGDTDLFKLPVAADRIYTVTLAHNAVDRDLIAYTLEAPETPLRAITTTRPSIAAVADEGADLENRSDRLAPNVVGDIDFLDGLKAVGVSVNRGTSPELVRFTSERAGTAIIQVAGYLQAGSAEPYTLRITETATDPIPPCAPRQFAFDSSPHSGTDELTSRGTLPAAIPATSRTLILVNRDRLHDAYGEAAAASIMTKLTALSLAERVKGTVIPVDGDDAVRAAEAKSDTDPCSIVAANGVVRAINNLVDRLRNASTADIDYVVLVGDDIQLPGGRLPDRTATGNERAYAATVARATGGEGNSLLAAYGRSRLLSDAPYGAFKPLPWLGGYLYAPGGDADNAVSVGRLLETPSEIITQIDRFAATGGALQLGKSLTLGDDFMVDATTAIHSALQLLLGSTNATLLTAGFTAADLHAALFPATGAPQAIALGIHGDHTRLQPAAGSALYSTADLLAGGSLAGRLLWAISCHSGTPVADLLRAGATGAELARLTDWAQAVARGGAGAFIGQTGYGLGLTNAIGLTEELMASFAANLKAGISIGSALEIARRLYLDGRGVYGVYDEKVLHEANLYGLPMIGDGGNPATAAPGTGGGTVTESVSFTPNLHLVTDSKQGSYYQAGSETPLIVHSRPIQPASRKGLGIQARGALIAGIDGFFERAGFNPVMASIALAGSGARSEPQFGDVRFPSTPLQVGITGRTVVANLGSFRSTGSDAGQTIGNQRVFTAVRAIAGGPANPANTDFDPPTIVATNATSSDGSATVTATIRDAAAASIVLLDGSGRWRVIDLVSDGTEWKATFPVVGGFEYFVQSRDQWWNTAFSLNKGGDFFGNGGPPPPVGGKYTFVGPHPPTSLKTIQAGSNIPFKFDVFEGSQEVTDTKVVRDILWYRVPCPGEGQVVADATHGDVAALKYDSGQFHYGWSTSSAWADTCRAIQVELIDGSAHAIYYRFKT